MLGIALLYVGAVLFVNGLWMLGKADNKSAAVLNALVGGLILVMALNNQFKADAMPGHFATAQSLLFAFTYIWVSLSLAFGLQTRALGYYCLFVAIVALPTAYLSFGGGDWRFGIIWLVWGGLWFLFFVLMGLQKSILKLTSYATLGVSVMTGVVGYLMLVEHW